MANSLSTIASTPWTGLGTATYNMLTSAMYTVQVQMIIPYVASGSSDNSAAAALDPAASALQIVVNNNGSPVLTLSAPSPTQPSLSGAVTFSGTAGNNITVVLTSANASDAVPNAVKGLINVFTGPI